MTLDDDWGWQLNLAEVDLDDGMNNSALPAHAISTVFNL